MFTAPLLPGPFRLLSLPFLSLLTPPSFLSPQLVCELLHEGQVISVGVSAESGRGGQWLARIRQLIKEGSVSDVSLVPVGISYDSVPKTSIQVDVCKCTLENTQDPTVTVMSPDQGNRFCLEVGFLDLNL